MKRSIIAGKIMAGLKELILRHSDNIVKSTWHDLLLNFNIQARNEYFKLPANAEILHNWLTKDQIPENYEKFCKVNLQRAEMIEPVAHEECRILDERIRQARLKGKKIPDDLSDFILCTQRDCLESLITILKSPAACDALLIRSTLRNLYYQLPEMHLPYGYNQIHDFEWRGMRLLNEDHPDTELFLLRSLTEPYYQRRGFQRETHPYIPGNPISFQPTEFRYRKGQYESESYVDVFINMDMNYYFSLDIESYNASSFQMNFPDKPVKKGRFNGKEDPEGYKSLLRSYGQLLARIYDAIEETHPRSLIVSNGNIE